MATLGPIVLRLTEVPSLVNRLQCLTHVTATVICCTRVSTDTSKPSSED